MKPQCQVTSYETFDLWSRGRQEVTIESSSSHEKPPMNALLPLSKAITGAAVLAMISGFGSGGDTAREIAAGYSTAVGVGKVSDYTNAD